MKTLFTNVDILIGDKIYTILKDSYLAVDGTTISYIGNQRPIGNFDITKKMSNHLLIPGLYNMHTHTPMTLLRGVGSGLPLDRWLNEKVFPIEAKLIPEDYVIGSQLAIMEMLCCGTVSFTDMYDRPWITADEVIKAGMKANLNRPVLGFDKTLPYSLSNSAKESVQFFQDYNGVADGRIKVEFAIHAEYTNYDSLAKAYAEDCAKYGAQMHIHLSETAKEHTECKIRHHKTPTEWFRDLGVLSNKTTAAHCVWVEDSDIEILADNGVTCVHNPTSNMKLGSGYMPIKKLMASNINIAIGTDGTASNNNLNMLEEMHLASIIHNGYHQDPELIKPCDIISMATINGAKGQSRYNCGSLEIGRRADIVAINLDRPHLMPILDEIALLTYSVQSSDVAMTMVDGAILYENGEYLTIDTDKVKYLLSKSINRLYN